MKQKPFIPTEYEEQKILIQWLDFKKLKFTATAQSTFTGWAQKMKNKAMGVRRGLPDIVIIHNKKMLWIELKRRKGGIISPFQKEWIVAINSVPSCQAVVCRGATEAINVIKKILNIR